MRQISGHALWLGHVGDATDLPSVLSAGIVAIVDLALNEPPLPITRDLVYCRFPLVDGAENPAWLLRAAIDLVAALLRTGAPTLVCCSAGMSRSPAIAAAALSLVASCPSNDALALVSQCGPTDVSPGLWCEVQAVVASPPALVAEGDEGRTLDRKVVTIMMVSSSDGLEDLAGRSPVWVIDTPANRAVVERLRTQSGSGKPTYDLTTFRSDATSPEEAVAGILETVDLHHGNLSCDPPYDTVEVVGASPSAAVRAKLADLGLTVTAEWPDRFIAMRLPNPHAP